MLIMAIICVSTFGNIAITSCVDRKLHIGGQLVMHFVRVEVGCYILLE